MKNIIKAFAALAVAAVLGACGTMGSIDRGVDNALKRAGVLVSGSTSFSNSITRDGEAWRGDTYTYRSCTDSVDYNRSVNRYFDYRGNMRYPENESHNVSRYCSGETIFPRLDRSLIAPRSEGRPTFPPPPPPSASERPHGTPPKELPPVPPTPDESRIEPAPPAPPTDIHPSRPSKERETVQF